MPSTDDVGIPGQGTLLPVAGGLSFAGVLIGLAILLLCCAGFDAALAFSPLPIVMGTAGGLITVATSWRGHPGNPESSTLAAIFIALLAILGGLLEMAAWLQWPILFTQHH